MGFRMLILVIGLLALSVSCGISATVTPTSVLIETPPQIPTETLDPIATVTLVPDGIISTGPMVRVEELVFPVELADSPDKRIRGYPVELRWMPEPVCCSSSKSPNGSVSGCGRWRYLWI